MTKTSPSADSAAKDPGNLSQRRRWLLGAVAGAAALGGAGLAWRNYLPPAQTQDAEPGLWQLEFATPQGEKLAMEHLRGKPLLLNFWATWCPPCVEELPLLSTFYRQNSLKGWQVLGLAVDQVEPVKRFLAQAPVAFPVAMAGMSGIELSRSLGNLAGSLPFTVVLGSDTRVAHRKMGKVSADDLRAWTALN
jgi:thiol-disulfide isomerase/thioredoxin